MARTQETPLRAAQPTYTASVEDYLKAIYDLARRTGTASTTDIAGRLNIATASVSAMLRRLARLQLLTHAPYHGVRLTKKGQRVALRTIRRHRVIETFLVRVLHYPWDEIHDEAERLEHSASDQLVDRMAAASGEPEIDPHGAPIPTRNGEVDEGQYESLAELALGTRARVALVSDEDSARLRYLAECGLIPGAQVMVLDRAPFGGPINVRVGATTRSIGLALGAVVWVEASNVGKHQAARALPKRPHR